MTIPNVIPCSRTMAPSISMRSASHVASFAKSLFSIFRRGRLSLSGGVHNVRAGLFQSRKSEVGNRKARSERSAGVLHFPFSILHCLSWGGKIAAVAATIVVATVCFLGGCALATAGSAQCSVFSVQGKRAPIDLTSPNPDLPDLATPAKARSREGNSTNTKGLAGGPAFHEPEDVREPAAGRNP